VDAERMRVLIVDDNADGAASLAALFDLDGHETRTASDGVEAVAAAESYRPDVILLDLGLPRLSGLDACRAIRRRPWSRDVVIIALTGWGQREDRERSTAAGFDAHVVKPIEHEALMALVGNLRANKGGLHK
jgi:CheY-like chemotaxis protein